MIIERLPYELRQVDNVLLLRTSTARSTPRTSGAMSSSSSCVRPSHRVAAFVTLTTNARPTTSATSFSKQVLFQPRANKNCYLEAYLQYTEQNTSMANVAFGIMSGVATGAFQSAGAGIRTTGTFIGIYKKSGDTDVAGAGAERQHVRGNGIDLLVRPLDVHRPRHRDHDADGHRLRSELPRAAPAT